MSPLGVLVTLSTLLTYGAMLPYIQIEVLANCGAWGRLHPRGYYVYFACCERASQNSIDFRDLGNEEQINKKHLFLDTSPHRHQFECQLRLQYSKKFRTQEIELRCPPLFGE